MEELPNPKYDRRGLRCFSWRMAPSAAREKCDVIVWDLKESLEDRTRHLITILRHLVFFLIWHADDPDALTSSCPTIVGQDPSTISSYVRRPQVVLPWSHGGDAPYVHTAASSSSSNLQQCAPEVVKILQRLIETLKKDEDRGYAQWIAASPEQINGATQTFMTDKALQTCVQGRWEKEAILNLQQAGEPDSNVRSAGWYMDIITDKNDGDFMKLYVGQAANLYKRIQEHRSKFRTDKGLHYTMARQPGREMTFVVLGMYQNPQCNEDDLSMLLNFGEAFFALIFQTLPRPTLEKYLPPGTAIREPERGLNVSNPLNQGDRNKAKQAFSLLQSSTDPEVQEYWTRIQLKSVGHMQDVMRTDHNLGFIRYRRGGSKYTKYYYPPDPQNGRPLTMQIKCNRCTVPPVITDWHPQYTEDGSYLVRKHECPRGCLKSILFVPVDATVRYIIQETYREWCKKCIVKPAPQPVSYI